MPKHGPNTSTTQKPDCLVFSVFAGGVETLVTSHAQLKQLETWQSNELRMFATVCLAMLLAWPICRSGNIISTLLFSSVLFGSAKNSCTLSVASQACEPTSESTRNPIGALSWFIAAFWYHVYMWKWHQQLYFYMNIIVLGSFLVQFLLESMEIASFWCFSGPVSTP